MEKHGSDPDPVGIIPSLARVNSVKLILEFTEGCWPVPYLSDCAVALITGIFMPVTEYLSHYGKIIPLREKP